MPQFLVRPEDLQLAERRALVRGDEVHHLVRVLRARTGKAVDLFDGQGRRWRGFLGVETRDGVRVEDLEALPPNEAPLAVELLHGFPKGEKWDWILEKSTELGVKIIQPLFTERGVPRIPPTRLAPKVDRWTKRVLAAAKQCERALVPEVREPLGLPEFLAGLPEPGEREYRVVLAEREPHAPLPRMEQPPRTVRIAVGPEGGWANAERRALDACGFHALSLGPRILRSETAAVVALALVQSRWGDLVGGTDGW